jgi:hypothetical protein
MIRIRHGFLALGMVVVAVAVMRGVTASGAAEARWAMNATAIEACSCTMFCQCYFNLQPDAHDHTSGKKHFCRANIAYRVNKGHHGSTRLDGAKFWLANDLGGDFSQGKMDWVVLTYDRALTNPQREAIKEIVSHLFPVQWNSFTTAEGHIDQWTFDQETAVATLDGGKTAEVRLRRPKVSANGEGPVVIKNLKYWGSPRNDGFVLMPNEVEAYRVGPDAFEFKGTNGFMITVDINANDIGPKKSSM